jgi:hypothetical protein
MKTFADDGGRVKGRQVTGSWSGALPLCCIFAMALALGCATEEGDWQRAQATGTVESYEAFLSARPGSRYAGQAVDGIWRVIDNNQASTISDFEGFLARHRSSSHASVALDRIWTLTTIKHTMTAYEAYAAKHASDPRAEDARAAAAKLWAVASPPKPDCALTSALKVDVSWKKMPLAQSYVLYWSTSHRGQRNHKRSQATAATAFTHSARVGEYGARLPMFYRVAAVHNGVESGLSDVCVARLLPDHNGTRCQICGKEAIGYCHLREIYVCANHNTFMSDSGTYWQCP